MRFLTGLPSLVIGGRGAKNMSCEVPIITDDQSAAGQPGRKKRPC